MRVGALLALLLGCGSLLHAQEKLGSRRSPDRKAAIQVGEKSKSATTRPDPTQAKPGSALEGAKVSPVPSVAAPAVRPPSRSVGPQVLSRAAADALRPRSPFLLPPDAAPGDRYTPDELDWREIPPWRQTSFFGIRARGQFFIYVVDQSESMIDDDRLARATIELRRSVFALQPPQRFEVIFYNEGATPMPGGPLPRSADQRTKDQLTSWLRLIEPEGETHPLDAVAQALSLRPDAVFLLSDGEYPEGTAESIARINPRKVPIHCIDLTGGLAGDQLKRIARESGGRYASRPGSLHATP